MMIIIIQKLQDITDMGWQLKSEYDDCIKVLNARLREQDSLINQLKDQTAALMQELVTAGNGLCHMSHFCDRF